MRNALMTRTLLIALHQRLIDALIALILPALFLLSACGGHGQGNKQGTSVVDQPKEQTR